MTKIVALSDEELQIKAAELLGWKKLESPTRVYQAGSPGREFDAQWLSPDGDYEFLPPDYPNDIAAAWELEAYLLQAYADGEVENTELISSDNNSGLLGPTGQLGQEFTQAQEAHPWARYTDALGRILGIHLALLIYEDFGRVEYKDIFTLIHASPRDRTRAFVLAMEKSDG